jgi:DNA-binding SARP family transcriptional activator/predicted ATPase
MDANMTSELQITLFGGLQIAQAGTPLTAFMSNKAPALLAYLAMSQRAYPRDSLTALLWGEMGDADAKNNLRQVLTNLRKLIEPHLIVTRDSVGFNHQAPYMLDVELFEAQLRISRTLLPEQRLVHLQQTVALYTGDFLAGFFVRDAPEFEEWMLAHKARLREVALHALHELTQLQLNRGQYGAAIDSASRSLALDPWREEAHRHLMLALARSGQRSAALAQYKSCQRVLSTELGVEPASETQVLYARIRATGEAIPHNLPTQPTSFVGRLDELAALEEALLDPTCRLLTLVGVGGVGKTRLALQAAERLLRMGAFLNGVYLAPLAGLDRPDLLVTALAEACGLLFGGNKDPKTQLIEYLRSQEVLLLLDNFEHLLEAGPWLGELLQRAPGVKCLVTSRERLHIRREHLIELTGLSEPNAVALFNERARSVDRQFVADPATASAIARICQLVAGLPLAVELAAASMRQYSCAAIADAIARNLDLLTGALRDVPARHRSVRAVFDHSWQWLTPAEQQLFLALAVFPGTFSLAAAETICSAPAVAGMLHPLNCAVFPGSRSAHFHTALASLLDKSLLQRSSDGRVQMHALLRQYAAEKLAQQPLYEATVAQQHSHFYATFLAEQTEQISSSRQQEILSAIEQEGDNVRAAWRWAMAHEPEHTLAPMIDPLFEYYEVRSLMVEASERFDLALQAVQQRDPQQEPMQRTLVKLLNRQARFLARLGQRTQADALLLQSSQLAQQLGLVDELAAAYNYQGLNRQGDGNYAEAVACFQRSAQLCRIQEDRPGLARALNNLGVISLRQGKLDEADRYLQEALALRRQMANPKLIADSLNNLGILLHEVHEYGQEAALLREALAYYRQLDDRKGISVTLHNLGGVHLALKQFDQARQFLEEALTLRQYDPTGLANTLNNLGTVALRAGDLSAARQRFGEALQVALDSRVIPMVHDILVGIAEVLLADRQAAIALELLAFVLPHAQDNETLLEAERLRTLARTAAPGAAAQAEATGMARTTEQSVARALQAVRA